MAFETVLIQRQGWVQFMRCYFMRSGHIDAIAFLKSTDDEGRIAESKKLFETQGKPFGAEGYEVWDGNRFVYRFPENGNS